MEHPIHRVTGFSKVADLRLPAMLRDWPEVGAAMRELDAEWGA